MVTQAKDFAVQDGKTVQAEFFAPRISRHAYFLIAFSSPFAYYTLFLERRDWCFQPAFQDMNTN